MQELDFLQNINNKEIILEILHNSIDFLIGNKEEQHTLKLCHKYGLNSPDEFMLATRTIARHYRNCCTENLTTELEIMSEFGNLSGDLQRLVPIVLSARRPEIIPYLVRQHNAQEHPLVESFDWDLRLILGDSSSAQNQRKLATCTFNCRNNNGKRSVLHFQMDKEKLDEVIVELEKAVKDLNDESENKVN